MIKIKLIAFVLFWSLLSLSCEKEDKTTGDIINVNDILPNFELTNTNGERVSTTSLKGKVSVIMFFNTNCKDCQRELPGIEKLYQLYKDNHDFELVAIARSENESDVASYFEKNKLTFPFCSDKNREVYALFATTTIPRVYLSDTNLSVRWMQAETINWQALQNKISELLQKTGNPE